MFKANKIVITQNVVNLDKPKSFLYTKSFNTNISHQILTTQ